MTKPSRVVSLVPSLTESLAVSAPEVLVGATQWCTEPPDLDVARVRGTKNPDLAAIRALEPDLVIANKEENRELDVRRLRAAGIGVLVTVIETVPEALTALDQLFTRTLGLRAPDWLDEATALWSRPVPEPALRVAVPIWRDPWMVVGRSTFAGDLLRRAGLVNVYADHADRYPTLSVREVDAAGADLVLLPDEPYVFTADDGPAAFPTTATRLVSGRLITWYGPSLVQAHHMLAELIAERRE